MGLIPVAVRTVTVCPRASVLISHISHFSTSPGKQARVSANSAEGPKLNGDACLMPRMQVNPIVDDQGCSGESSEPDKANSMQDIVASNPIGPAKGLTVQACWLRIAISMQLSQSSLHCGADSLKLLRIVEK